MQIKQKVSITIHTLPEGGGVVFADDKLRIDFDIRKIPEFNRATFTLYNLNDKTIKAILNGTRYVTLKTQLHDGREYTLAEGYQINNTVDEIILPNRVVTLYTFDQTRGKLQKPVDKVAANPSLEGAIKVITEAVGISTATKFVSFPPWLVKEVPPRQARNLEGSAQQCLRKLEKEFKFNTYTDSGGLVLMHKPNLRSVPYTDLPSRPADVVLTTQSMRANPRLGAATATIVSNLDPDIKPAGLLDLSQLLTAGVNADQRTLELVDNFTSSVITGFQKYQAFTVQHKGSNYTAEWSTVVNCLSPTEGLKMPTSGAQWAQIRKSGG